MSEGKRQRPTLKKIGLWGTIAYLVFLGSGIVIAAKFGWLAASPLALNELGDLLAGAFGPLAIGWVVLGFLQQGEELKESRKALVLQANELKNAVDQHREMVRVASATLEHEKTLQEQELARRMEAVRPKLSANFEEPQDRGLPVLGNNRVEQDLVITNAGGNCFHLRIELLNGNSIEATFEKSSLPSATSVRFPASTNFGLLGPTDRVHATYQDTNGKQYSERL